MNLGQASPEKTLSNAVKASLEEVNERSKRFVKTNAAVSSGFPVMADGTSYTVAACGLDKDGENPEVRFEAKANKDIICHFSYTSSFDSKNRQRWFRIQLPENWQSKAAGIAHSLQWSRENGALKVTLPNQNEVDSLAEDVFESATPFRLPTTLSSPKVVGEGSIKLNIPSNVAEILTKGVSVQGLHNNASTGGEIFIAMNGDYNAGKTWLINSIMNLARGDDEGNTAHTEDVNIFHGKIEEKKVAIIDCMGTNSGQLQSSTGTTDEEVRQRQHAIAGFASPQKANGTILVTNGFDTHTAMALEKYDWDKTIVLHNLSNLTPDTTKLYLERFKNFARSMGEQSEQGPSEWRQIDGVEVCRQPSGLTHFFMRNDRYAEHKAQNRKTIDLLRQTIAGLQPRGTSLEDTIKELFVNMMNRSFVVPKGATVEALFSDDGKTIKPKAMLKGLDITEALAPRNIQQDKFVQGSYQVEELGLKETSGETTVDFYDPKTGSTQEIQRNCLTYNIEAPYADQSTNGLSYSLDTRKTLLKIEYSIPSGQGCSLFNLPSNVSAVKKGDNLDITLEKELLRQVDRGNLPDDPETKNGAITLEFLLNKA